LDLRSRHRLGRRLHHRLGSVLHHRLGRRLHHRLGSSLFARCLRCVVADAAAEAAAVYHLGGGLHGSFLNGSLLATRGALVSAIITSAVSASTASA